MCRVLNILSVLSRIIVVTHYSRMANVKQVLLLLKTAFDFTNWIFLSLCRLIAEMVGHSMSCVKGRCEVGLEGEIEYQMHTFGRIHKRVAGKYLLPCRGF